MTTGDFEPEPESESESESGNLSLPAAGQAHKGVQKPSLPPVPDVRERELYASLDGEGRGHVFRSEVISALEIMGIHADDMRLKESLGILNRYREKDPISFDDFCQIIRPNIVLFERVLRGNLVIPEFGNFCHEIERIYQVTRTNEGGKVADYIPQLGRVNPDQYGLALCTIDGQRFELGESNVDFGVQSCCKPVNYCLALEEHGPKVVHKHIGWEPSGHSFNEIKLDLDFRPHNPMINAGAIVACSLVKPKLDTADRFDFVMDRWKALSGGKRVGFSNSVYLSERQTADRNFALGYFMQEHKAFPEGTKLIETLEFYFQCCSIEVTAQQMAVVAATLANGGVCPLTGERIFRPRTVQNCLSLMYSCGMYDFSGEFAFSIGLPAKSGVSGALMIVVPNVMGLCTWSPRLDRHGNSVRGVEFCRSLVEKFNFHNYDSLTGLSEKEDPRRGTVRAQVDQVVSLIWAASKGDLTGIQHLLAAGADLNGADYDGRTPLHLAASEGHLHVVRFLIQQRVQLNPRDRWGNTPLQDAYRGNHASVVALLEKHGGSQ